MLAAITLLLCCQLVGEIIRVVTDVPVPGPVIGMVLLFAGLLIRRRLAADDKPDLPEELGATALGLLRHLSLLFVPAGVGVMLYLPLIAKEWLAISAALVGSTVITIAATALVMSWLSRDTDETGGQSKERTGGP